MLSAYPTWPQHRSSLFVLDLAHAMVCEENTEETLNALNFFFSYIKPTKQKQQKTSAFFAILLLSYSNQEHSISASSLTASFQICFPQEQTLACR